MAEYLICTLRGRNLWNGGRINFKGESPCNSFIPDTEEEVRTTFGSLLFVDPSVQQGLGRVDFEESWLKFSAP